RQKELLFIFQANKSDTDGCLSKRSPDDFHYFFPVFFSADIIFVNIQYQSGTLVIRVEPGVVTTMKSCIIFQQIRISFDLLKRTATLFDPVQVRVQRTA